MGYYRHQNTQTKQTFEKYCTVQIVKICLFLFLREYGRTEIQAVTF
jgi:hypothetical protein